VMVAMPRAL